MRTRYTIGVAGLLAALILLSCGCGNPNKPAADDQVAPSFDSTLVGQYPLIAVQTFAMRRQKRL